MKKVGYLGNHGTFSEIAVNTFFKEETIDKKNYKDFPQLVKDTEEGVIDYALLPVENTTTGIISRTYDLFKDHEIYAVGEVDVSIVEDLIVVPGTTLDQIKEVYSHPEPIEQCSHFFREHPQIKPVVFQDTARSVAYIKECNDPSKAALASSLAAKYYGMESLLCHVQDIDTNTTRFLCVSHEKEMREGANKISIMLVLKHEPGALSKVLNILAAHEINLLKLESRPIPGKMFEYCFYMDFDGNLNEPKIQVVLDQIKKDALDYKVLGCYPKHKM